MTTVALLLDALFLIAFVGDGLHEVRQMLRLRISIPGCCPTCGGTGNSGDTAVPGGLCWDCQATGHPHLGLCSWERGASR